MNSALGYNSNVFLAPMAGVTDKPLRLLMSAYGGGVMCSEMAAVNALERKNLKSQKISDVRDESYPVIVQLMGNDPVLFAEAAKLVEELGACAIDLNMGCPVKKIVNNHAGSALMKDMPTAAKIIATTVKATSLPVSVKFRKGWDDSHVNAVEFAKMCEENGAQHIAVHGRTKSQMYAGKADWDIIKAVKENVKIPVIGNGDVDSPQTAAAMLAYTKADGVMVGRAVFGRPWLIAEIDDYIKSGTLPKPKTAAEIKSAMLKHLELLAAYYGEKTALAVSRKYICWYCKGMYDAKKFRETFIKINNVNEALREIDIYFAQK